MAEASKKAQYLVGVDLGGTKIMAGIFDLSLECLGWAKISTKAQRGPAAVMDRIARCVSDAVDECDLKTVSEAASSMRSTGESSFPSRGSQSALQNDAMCSASSADCGRGVK